MAYMSIIMWTIIVAVKTWRKQDNVWTRTFALGFLVGLIALLINATFIDVFASSKVAFTLWFMVAMIFASQWSFLKRKNVSQKQQALINLPWLDDKKSEAEKIPLQVKNQIKEANELKIEEQLAGKIFKNKKKPPVKTKNVKKN